jgi:glutathione S-transferase
LLKLYFSPGACSLSPHIILRESGLQFELEHVDLQTKRTVAGADFLAVNPKGLVPALVLSDGDVLTEGPAIVQFIADSVPARNLIPAAGTMRRYRILEWLNFITSELHKSFSWFLRDELFRNAAAKLISERFEFVETSLSSKSYLMGDSFTVADAYLFVMTAAAVRLKFDFEEWPNLAAFHQRVLRRPVVMATLAAEGIDPSFLMIPSYRRLSRVAGELAKFAQA